MGKALIFTDRALNEYDNILEYLFSEWSDEITVRVVNELEQTLLNIQNYPEHYPVFIKSKKIHRCVASPQTSVYFKIYRDKIEIISFFDNRQNPKKRRL